MQCYVEDLVPDDLQPDRLYWSNLPAIKVGELPLLTFNVDPDVHTAKLDDLIKNAANNRNQFRFMSEVHDDNTSDYQTSFHRLDERYQCLSLLEEHLNKNLEKITRLIQSHVASGSLLSIEGVTNSLEERLITINDLISFLETKEITYPDQLKANIRPKNKKTLNTRLDQEPPPPILYDLESQDIWMTWILENEGIDPQTNKIKPRFRAQFLEAGKDGISPGTLINMYDRNAKKFRS